MFEVCIREHIMIAHSLPNDFFGPAQKLHGATYVIDVSFASKTLNEYNVVVDIGWAHEITKEILAPLQYQNLDTLEEFKNQITTTEFLAYHIFTKLKEKSKSVFDGNIKVTLNESHVASCSYQG